MPELKLWNAPPKNRQPDNRQQVKHPSQTLGEGKTGLRKYAQEQSDEVEPGILGYAVALTASTQEQQVDEVLSPAHSHEHKTVQGERKRPSAEPPPHAPALENEWDGEHQRNLRTDDKHGEAKSRERVFLHEHAVDPKCASRAEGRRYPGP